MFLLAFVTLLFFVLEGNCLFISKYVNFCRNIFKINEKFEKLKNYKREKEEKKD